MEFQDELKRLRALKGVTQAELGKAIHVSRSAVAKWEAGLGVPSEDSTLALCEYFSVTKETLFPNREAEPLLVEKNVTIRKRKGIIGFLCVLLSIVTLFAGAFIGHLLVQKKREEARVERLLSLCPTVVDVYFNPRVGLIQEEVQTENGAYLLTYGEWTPLYFEIVLDSQICEQWYELVPTFDGFDTFYLQKLTEYYHYKGNGSLRRQIYSVLVRTEDVLRSKLLLTSLAFRYVPNTERVEKYCVINAKALPVKIVIP